MTVFREVPTTTTCAHCRAKVAHHDLRYVAAAPSMFGISGIRLVNPIPCCSPECLAAVLLVTPESRQMTPAEVSQLPFMGGER